MTRIEVTFYTGSDDFSTEFTLEDARRWVGSRVSGPAVITTPSGEVLAGETSESIDESGLAKWFAAIALGEARKGKALDVREREGTWVAINPAMVRAVGAQVIDDEADGHDDDVAGSASDEPRPSEDLWNSIDAFLRDMPERE